MKINTPVTNVERPYPRGQYIVSRTDLKGVVTWGNEAFFAVSGFARDELVGKNHNLVRHPDMPPAAFAEVADEERQLAAAMDDTANRLQELMRHFRFIR